MTRVEVNISEIKEQMQRIGKAAPRIVSNALSAAATPVNRKMKETVPVVTGMLKKSIGKSRGLKLGEGKVSVNILVRPEFIKKAGTEYVQKNKKTGKEYVRKTKVDVPVFWYGIPLIRRRKLDERVMLDMRSEFDAIFNRKLKEEIDKFKTKYRI